jgi:ADP-heptose:LPS heptosyltransferase
MQWEYVENNREGDHICYISDLSKIRRHYPGWDITRSLDEIFCEIYKAHLASGEKTKHSTVYRRKVISV